MVELVELTGGYGIIRRPSGVEVFNSNDRMPAALATVNTTVSVDFPMTGYESHSGGFNITTTTSAHSITANHTLQSYSHPVAPTFFMGEIKLTRTLVGASGSGTGTLGAGIPEATWMPFGGGSLFIEGSGAAPYRGFNYISGLGLARFINFAVVGSNIVLQAHQMSQGRTSVLYPAPAQSSRSTWSIECRLICGFFDL